jgi:hypothetical protein
MFRALLDCAFRAGNLEPLGQLTAILEGTSEIWKRHLEKRMN